MLPIIHIWGHVSGKNETVKHSLQIKTLKIVKIKGVNHQSSVKEYVFLQ